MSPIDPAVSARLATALADSPAALFAVLSDLFKAIPGVETITYIATAPDHSLTHRIGTSNPAHFPIGGYDLWSDGPWHKGIFGEKRALVGDNPAQMAEFLGETDGLIAMGYGSTLCTPIVIAGEVRGVVAVLGQSGIFTPAALAAIDTLLPLVALAFTFEGISEKPAGL